MKKCKKCGVVKQSSEFHRDKTRKDGLRSACKPCVATYMGLYYSNNKEKVMGRVIEWVERNRERHNKKCSRWVKRNRGKVNARTARRYASKTQATPKWVSQNPEMLWMINEVYDLAKLRTDTTGKKWEVDHIIPIRGKDVCGLHTPFNLQVVLQSENRKKSNKLIY